MPTLRRPTFALYYDDRGPRDAPAVVLMPSFLCDRTMFAHLADTLASRHRVLAVDLRGHGRSTTPSRDYALEDQADDIAAVLDDAGVATATMVGLSQGGMTALRLALYHPKRVRTLVLMDSSAASESAFVRAKYLGLAAIFRVAGLFGPIENEVTRLMFSDGFRRDHADAVTHAVAAWRALDRMGVVRSIRAIANRADLVARLGEIRVPTLVVCGTDDAALPIARSEQLARGIDGARFVRIEGAGHLSTVEKPEETTAAVVAFLASLRGAP